MDFAFTSEQEMLRGQTRSYLADRFPIDRVIELAESDDGWDEKSWREIAELGWTGLSIAEAQGGSEMGFIEEAVILEEMGRALYPGPYTATVGFCLPALRRADELASAIAAGELSATAAWTESSSDDGWDGIETHAKTSDGAWSITGTKELVPDAQTAQVFVVTAVTDEGPGLFGVRVGDRVRVEELGTVDRTRRLGRVQFEGAAATSLSTGSDAAALWRELGLRSAASLALEAVGIAQRALEMAIEHAGSREQFGKKIGSYEAVSHNVANTYVATELARSLAYWAAWCVAESDEQAEIAVAAAKSAGADAAVLACENAIQVHGGMGFTWEHPLHRYYKRAEWIASYGGSSSAQRKVIAASLFDR
ncbi:MAG: acyl-CoA/acyl-ACP dehydrogenase [Actinomycetota bacterium]|nr:acyl-CoA/acyl-ACP dehydrogenase [Actinomycetota bacterium]